MISKMIVLYCSWTASLLSVYLVDCWASTSAVHSCTEIIKETPHQRRNATDDYARDWVINLTNANGTKKRCEQQRSSRSTLNRWSVRFFDKVHDAIRSARDFRTAFDAYLDNVQPWSPRTQCINGDKKKKGYDSNFDFPIVKRRPELW